MFEPDPYLWPLSAPKSSDRFCNQILKMLNRQRSVHKIFMSLEIDTLSPRKNPKRELCAKQPFGRFASFFWFGWDCLWGFACLGVRASWLSPLFRGPPSCWLLAKIGQKRPMGRAVSNSNLLALLFGHMAFKASLPRSKSSEAAFLMAPLSPPNQILRFSENTTKYWLRTKACKKFVPLRLLRMATPCWIWHRSWWAALRAPWAPSEEKFYKSHSRIFSFSFTASLTEM